MDMSREMDGHFEGGHEGFMRLHKESAPDIPCLMLGSQAMPWNGIQINVNHLSNEHSDFNDMANTPAFTCHFGVRTSVEMKGMKKEQW